MRRIFRSAAYILPRFFIILTPLHIGVVLADDAPAPQNRYARPAIDRNLFREGQVKRTQSHFNNWRVVCDEIAALRQKFCSLYSVAVGADHRAIFEVVVSTSVDGRPAAMARLPLGLWLTRGLNIAAPVVSKKKSASQTAFEVKMNACDQDACAAVWNLPPAHIAALMAGQPLILRYFTFQAREVWGAPYLERAATLVEARLEGLGFSEAIRESLSGP